MSVAATFVLYSRKLPNVSSLILLQQEYCEQRQRMECCWVLKFKGTVQEAKGKIRN